jgi:putative transposase
MDSNRRKKVRHYNLTNHAHELTFSCFRNYPLLAFDQTRYWLIEALRSSRTQLNYSILCFVIMPDHVHLVVYPQEMGYDISLFLRSVKQSVSRKASRWFAEHDPEWHKKLIVQREEGSRVFRFWQAGGGYDRNVTGRDTLIQMIAYIHNNPARKGLVKDPIDWKWSSASHYLAGACPILDIDPVPR